jgi:hypothetical protein
MSCKSVYIVLIRSAKNGDFKNYPSLEKKALELDELLQYGSVLKIMSKRCFFQMLAFQMYGDDKEERHRRLDQMKAFVEMEIEDNQSNIDTFCRDIDLMYVGRP